MPTAAGRAMSATASTRSLVSRQASRSRRVPASPSTAKAPSTPQRWCIPSTVQRRSLPSPPARCRATPSMCNGAPPTSLAARVYGTPASSSRSTAVHGKSGSAKPTRPVAFTRGRRASATNSLRCRPTTPATASWHAPHRPCRTTAHAPTWAMCRALAGRPLTRAHHRRRATPHRPTRCSPRQRQVCPPERLTGRRNSPRCSRRSRLQSSVRALRKATPASARSRCSSDQTAASSQVAASIAAASMSMHKTAARHSTRRWCSTRLSSIWPTTARAACGRPAVAGNCSSSTPPASPSSTATATA